MWHGARTPSLVASPAVANVVVCSNCQASLRYGQAPQQRKQVACPRCGHTLVIPSALEELSLVTPTAPRPDATPLGAAPLAAPPPPPAPAETPAWPAPAAAPPARGVQGHAPTPRPHRDEFDDRPRRSRREARDHDDDDASRRPSASYDDYGTADDFERPRRRKKSGKGLLIGLLIGGGALLIGGVVLVLLLVLGGGNPLVGRWRPVGVPGADGVTIEFTSGGQIVVNAMGRTERARYRILDSGSLEVEPDAGGGFGFGGGARKEVASFRIERDELVITPPRGPALRLRRI